MRIHPVASALLAGFLAIQSAAWPTVAACASMDRGTPEAAHHAMPPGSQDHHGHSGTPGERQGHAPAPQPADDCGWSAACATPALLPVAATVTSAPAAQPRPDTEPPRMQSVDREPGVPPPRR